MTIFIAIVAFLGVLFILVIAHELGHFLSARMFGIKVEEFGFGIPPRLFGFQRKGVLWSVNILPLGGFVRIKGEDGSSPKDRDSFAAQKIWKRFIVISSGVFINVLLAWIFIIAGVSIGWPSDLSENIPEAYIKERESIVIDIEEGSAAERAGLQKGDIMIKVNDYTIANGAELLIYLKDPRIQEFAVIVARKGKEYPLRIVRPPMMEDVADERSSIEQESWEKVRLGIGLREAGIVAYPFPQSLREGTKKTASFFNMIVNAFYDLFRDLVKSGKVSEDLAGPLGVAALTARVVRLGFLYIIQFVAILSLNLALVNFMPLPGLDGGRALFLIISKLKGREINARLEQKIHAIGIWVLIFLIFLLTVRDVMNVGRF